MYQIKLLMMLIHLLAVSNIFVFNFPDRKRSGHPEYPCLKAKSSFDIIVFDKSNHYIK